MSDEGAVMKEAWEVFWDDCVRQGMADTGATTGQAARISNAAMAISRAARATVSHLRDEREWTWVNSRIMAGKLVDVATDWALSGGVNPRELRDRLRAAWQEEREVAEAEASWRALTEAVIAGGRPDRQGSAAA
jgi:hypothetical protein